MTRVGETALRKSLHTGILSHLPAYLQPVCEIVERCFDDSLFPDDLWRYAMTDFDSDRRII